MNTPVIFELANLLKDKGFDKNGASSQLPTIADVVMWLYEKHGLWIKVDCASIYFWHPSIINIEDGSFKVHPYYIFFEQNNQNKMFESPNEAYEAAIKYSLNKLI